MAVALYRVGLLRIRRTALATALSLLVVAAVGGPNGRGGPQPSGAVWPARTGRLGRTVSVRVLLPEGAGGTVVPVTGGIPFPQGALRSAANVRLVASDGHEVPCQVARHAVWPDGSIKWALVDAVLAPRAGHDFTLEYGEGIRRAPVANGVHATLALDGVRIDGGGVHALVRKHGAGVVDQLSFGSRRVLAAGRPARLHLETIRIPEEATGRALPTARFVIADPGARRQVGKVVVESLGIEAPGPIRLTVLVRGHILVPGFGATLPDEVKRREPPGRLPFSMRLSFYRGVPLVTGQHQIVFTGEPDCDFIARWGIELPGCAGETGTLVLEPGAEMHLTAGRPSVMAPATRLCWAPMRGGFALIRHGWYHRPAGITQHGGSAWVDFWPQAAGVWDLRRYAREWAVGESGDPRRPEDMLRYARYAARGLAKSHDFVLHFGAADLRGPAPPPVRALSARALLVAPPAWYGATLALGPLAPEQTTGPFAALDARGRRQLDYMLFNQDLYRWHGKLAYGFFQSRFGEVHRHDRWDDDYGRWGWSLNDGGGRWGHLLMLQFLRMLDRRYFEAGEAFARANYDTNLVHTVQHLENARGWWTAAGCSHRHNVQPFGCPYLGMRGSYPVGQRLLYLLTGDGVVADGLELVADASFRYARGEAWRLCNSGGSDGQGSAANALLWKYEATGDRAFLDACRFILDRSGLVPPRDAAGLGYGPAFGLYHAAAEYACLAGDPDFRSRVIETARLAARSRDPAGLLHAIAMGAWLANDDALKRRLTEILQQASARTTQTLCDLPVRAWPGHGGYLTPDIDANLLRDAATGIGVLTGTGHPTWPRPTALPSAAAPPPGWYRPGGAQAPTDRVPAPNELLGIRPTREAGTLSAGSARWSARQHLADAVEVGGARPLASPIVPCVLVMQPTGGHPALASKAEWVQPRATKVGLSADGSLIVTAVVGPATLRVRARPSRADGIPSIRVEAVCRVSRGRARIASWGLSIPLRLGPDAHAVMATAPGRFRLERCRLDQNYERVPSWLAAMEGREELPHWPRWREAGIQAGPGLHYRVWHANRADTAPVYVDQGEGPCAWLDLTDRGASPRWGLTARVLRAGASSSDLSRVAVRANLETGLLTVEFHDQGAPPPDERQAAVGLVGACDLIFHDGWRPPLSRPELTEEQYARFITDLDFGGTYGLTALRFAVSDTHLVSGRQWMERVRDLGVEPREILYGMQRGGALAELCRRLGVPWGGSDVEGTVRRLIAHYR